MNTCTWRRPVVQKYFYVWVINWREMQRERDTERQRESERETQRDRENQRERQRLREKIGFPKDKGGGSGEEDVFR